MGTPVEVRKNPNSTTWYNATILDVIGRNIRVGFENAVWPSKLVPSYSVRRCPEDTDGLDGNPEVGDMVEVLVTASRGNPAGWALGVIKGLKNSFYFVGFMGSQRAAQDLIVERASLRPVSSEPSIDTTRMVRVVLPTGPELRPWIETQDFDTCLTDVQIKCDLLLVTWIEAECDEGDEPEVDILLVGHQHGVELASKLFNIIHFKYQAEMTRFNSVFSELEDRLSELKRIRRSQPHASFTQEPRFTRHLQSKAHEVRANLGVDVRVQERVPNPEGGPLVTMVTLSGPTEAAVMEAREELEFITHRIHVKDEEQALICGKSFQNIKSIARDTQLQYMKFDDLTNSLELCGLRENVEQARRLVHDLVSYLPAYQSLSQEKKAVQQMSKEFAGRQWSRHTPNSKGDRAKGGGKGRH